MGKIKASDAFDILVKVDKESIQKTFGTHGLGKIKNYFIDTVDTTVDVNSTFVNEAYDQACKKYAYLNQ